MRLPSFLKKLLGYTVKGPWVINTLVVLVLLYVLFVVGITAWLMFISPTLRVPLTVVSHSRGLPDALKYLVMLLLFLLYILAWGFFMATACWWQITAPSRIREKGTTLLEIMEILLVFSTPWIYWFWGMDLVATGLLATGQGVVAMVLAFPLLVKMIYEDSLDILQTVLQSLWQTIPFVVGGIVWLVLFRDAWSAGVLVSPLRDPLWFILLITGGISGVRGFKQGFSLDV